MLFVRKTGLFDLEKPSKRDQKVLIDRLVRLLTGLFVQSQLGENTKADRCGAGRTGQLAGGERRECRRRRGRGGRRDQLSTVEADRLAIFLPHLCMGA